MDESAQTHDDQAVTTLYPHFTDQYTWHDLPVKWQQFVIDSFVAGVSWPQIEEAVFSRFNEVLLSIVEEKARGADICTDR